MAEMASRDIQPYMYEPEYESGESDLENMDSSDSDSQDDNIGLHVDGRVLQPVNAWCGCTKCLTMPRNKECICCQEWSEVLDTKLDNIGCITDHPDFSTVCLREVVLCIAYIHFMAYKKIPGRAPENLTNRYVWIGFWKAFIHRDLLF